MCILKRNKILIALDLLFQWKFSVVKEEFIFSSCHVDWQEIALSKVVLPLRLSLLFATYNS